MPRRFTDWRRAPFWPLPAEREVDEELADHLELQTRRYVAAGMSPDAARAAALRRFGDVAGVREECHTIRHQMEADVRRTELWQDLRQDAAFAVRTLRASRGFTVVALLTLAIGIGATTAIFSVVSSVLLRALPYEYADRVVNIANGSADPSKEPMAVAPPEFADIRDQTRAFDHVVALQPQAAALVDDGEPERVTAYAVSPDLFDMLGARPALGRGFVADDGAEGSPAVVLLSHALWQRRYGGDSAVVGRVVALAGVPRTIIGVMPPDVRFPDAPVGYLRDRADLWIPYDWMRRRTEERGNQYLVVLARIRQGSPVPMAQDVAAIAERFRQDYPDRYQGSLGGGSWRLAVTPLREAMLGGVRRPLLVLTAAVGLVLLMGCVNVAGLMLARAQARRREMSVRLALGAGRGRLVRQLLTESAILALGGGVLGMGLAWAGVRLLVALDPGGIPRLDDTRLDGATLLFALGASLACGLLFGILPALQQSRADIRATLGDDARGATGGRHATRARAVLVAAEVAMAVVVLVGAALLARSFATLQRVQPGFAPAGVLSLQLSIPRQTYDSARKVSAFYEQAAARLAAIPGVAGVAGVYPLPMSGDGWGMSFGVEGRSVGPREEPPHAEFAVAMPGYFRAMRVPLLAGREFTPRDDADAPLVAVVDELLARQQWPGESALGKRIEIGGPGGTAATIVGIASHVYNTGPQERGEPQIYLPLARFPQRTLSLVVRTSDGPLPTAAQVGQAVHAVDAAVPVAQLRPMPDVVASATARQRFSVVMFGIFAAVALVLAAVGLYGTMAYVVAQRTRELGIRVALGGRPRDVRRLVVREGVAIAAAGLVVGAAAALALSTTLGSLLYEVRPTDPPTYAAITGLLLVVAVVASYVPAWQASRVDPVLALRE